MLKIVINTSYNAAATVALIDNLIPRLKQAGHHVERNNNNYKQFDVAIFMSPDSQVQKAKIGNKRILTCIMDPKIKRRRHQENAAADILVVTSIEQRDAFTSYSDDQNTIFTYSSMPDRVYKPKKHTSKNKTIIGYHGNREHLVCFYPYITQALDKVAEKHEIELWAIYNISALGKWNQGLPKKVKVRHIQWRPNIYEKELRKCDIGIANNSIPIQNTLGKIASQKIFQRPGLKGYKYRLDDYLIRHKYSTNVGRIYEFAMAGVPVIADFYPSASQAIKDGESGLIVEKASGWTWALTTLINQPELRTTMAKNLHKYFSKEAPTNKYFSQFNKLLEKKVHEKSTSS